MKDEQTDAHLITNTGNNIEPKLFGTFDDPLGLPVQMIKIMQAFNFVPLTRRERRKIKRNLLKSKK